jgi:hypothetical protein
MKKLFISLLLLLSLEFVFPQDAQAQTYQELAKDYCSGIGADNFTYSSDQLIRMRPVGAPGGSDSWNVVINSVKISESGTGKNQTFSVGQSFTPTQLSIGPKLLLPINSFIEQTTKDKTTTDSFDITVDKTINYQEGDPNDISKPFKSSSYQCATVASSAMQVPAKGQQQEQPNQNPLPANPAGPPVGGVNNLNVFCDAAKTKINTAIGCIPITATDDTIGWLLGWAIGISGGIALILIAVAGFTIMTASGDPQKLNGGRELLTAAVSGLILIIFSVFLLRLIGVSILAIPGLS